MVSEIRELIQYRSLLWSLVLSELRTRYKGSALGFLWTFVNPLLMLIVYTLVFSMVMKVKLPHYPVFLFIGLLAWNLFAQSVQSASGVIVRQSSLVNKIYFPRAILPLSIVGGAVINYLLSLAILIPLLLVTGFYPTWLWFFIPLVLLVECAFAVGVSLLVSSVNVYARDLEHILTVVVAMWFYLTPIVYPLDMISKRFQVYFKFNPLSDIILPFQSILYYQEPPHWKLFVYGSLASLLVLIAGWMIFQRLSRRFAEEV